MIDKTDDARVMLKYAIQGEKDGIRFYTFLAGKADNPDAKRKLTSLADDERRHQATLVQIYRKAFGEEAAELPAKGIGPLAEFFDKNLDKEDLSEVQYIDMAIEAELATTKYYKAGAESAADESTRKLYAEMAEEEFSHYELLKAEKDALSGNYYWFGFGDGSPMED